MCESDIGKTLARKDKVFKFVHCDLALFSKTSICCTFNEEKDPWTKFIFKCFRILNTL